MDSVQIVPASSLEEPFLKGTVQEPAYRDVYFAYAFVLQLVGVVVACVFYGREFFLVPEDSDGNRLLESSSTSNDDDDEGATVVSIVAILVASVLSAVFSTVGMLRIMIQYSDLAVQVSFAAAPCMLLLVGVVFLVVAPPLGPIYILSALIFAAISACVFLCYRRFLPFAASTLKTAVSAVQVHQGLFGMALATQVVATIATTVFVVSLTGLYLRADRVGGEVRCTDLYKDDEEYQQDPNEMCMKDPPVFGVIMLLFCAFWTQQVIQNVLHCTTAGTVGSWWFSGFGSDPSWWSRDISDSFGRAMTYSFGSICFGSLLVAILQTLEQMARSARRNRDGALLACILECILMCIRAWIEYFNSWAFVYVGLYGYDYLTAGKNVVQLFQNRGWSSFASDRLIFRVLYFALLAVALFSGGVAALVDAIIGPSLDEMHMFAFLIGFVVGLVLARCSLFVVESAVRTVIVSFAESPAEFSEHHPDLCGAMKAGWAAAYPDVWTEEYDLRFEPVPAMESPTNKSSEGEKETLLV